MLGIGPSYPLFASITTSLYVLSALAFHKIISKRDKNSRSKKLKSEALRFFVVQFLLSIFWSIIFFGFHTPVLSFAIIVVLCAQIGVTINLFLRISRKAAILMYPYFAWVVFAALINFAIVIASL